MLRLLAHRAGVHADARELEPAGQRQRCHLAELGVVFLLFIYALVIISCLKLRGDGETEDSYRANTVLLYLGVGVWMGARLLKDIRRQEGQN